MPRPSDKTKPLTIYPLTPVRERIEQVAAESGLSANQQVLAWIGERPEMQEVASGE